MKLILGVHKAGSYLPLFLEVNPLVGDTTIRRWIWLPIVVRNELKIKIAVFLSEAAAGILFMDDIINVPLCFCWIIDRTLLSYRCSVDSFWEPIHFSFSHGNPFGEVQLRIFGSGYSVPSTSLGMGVCNDIDPK